MKQILLIGAVYSDNLGDGAICQTMAGLLSESSQVYLMDIYGRTGYSYPTLMRINNIEIYFKKSVFKIGVRHAVLGLGIWPSTPKTKKKMQRVGEQVDTITSERTIDAIVFAGGALLKGVFLNYIYEILIHNKKNIPVYFNSCGVDGEMLPVEWMKLDMILDNENVKWISLRDGYEQFIRRYPNKVIMEAMDPAICANRIYKKSEAQAYIGLGVMISHKYKFKQQVSFWESLIKRLNHEGYQWKLFTNGSYEDQSFAIYILNRLAESTEHLIERPNDPSILYSVISGFDVIVSMRLHSHILAYSSGTPSIAVSWDNKIGEFFKKIDKSSNCLDFPASAGDVINRILAIKKECDYFDNKQNIEQLEDNNISALIEVIG